MRPLIWALMEVDPVDLHRHTLIDYDISSIIMSSIAPKQNAFKIKIAPLKQKSIVKKKWQEDVPLPLFKRGPVLKHT